MYILLHLKWITNKDLLYKHMELCSMLCASLDRRAVWGRMDTCICIAESLCCSPDTITTMLIGYTSIQNKKLKKNKIDNRQIPTEQHRELCSMLCSSLDGRGIWGKMDTCVCMAESLWWNNHNIVSRLYSYKIKSLRKETRKIRAN